LYNNLNHVALILDGNKRWAKKNKLSNIYGYSKGFENIKNLVKYSLSIKLPILTIFALSSENFHRSSISTIYKIIYDNFSDMFEELIQDKGVKIRIIGSKDNLPPKILEILKKIEDLSSQNKNLNLNIAFNYGFKNEIKSVIKKINNKKENYNIDNDEDLNKLFYLGSYPDPDILIRTGGYQRLSNFIMYNLTYTELFFTQTLWPEFSENEFQSILDKFSKIHRKYGL
tara:strand:- start:4714 stop:5397 length:684 start_codon:yes stop_codon:yes gene_type:complete